MSAPLNVRVCQRALRKITKLHHIFPTSNKLLFKSCHSGSDLHSEDVRKQDIGKVFTQPEIQKILKEVTGFKLDKIFKPRLTEAGAPKYKLVTEKQFKEMQDDAIKRAEEKLKMPPVMEPWKEGHTVVLSQDSEIEGFDKENSKHVFTDISFNIPDLERVIVVREPDGTLRTAEPAEHDRLINTYFPRPGRMHYAPKLFEGENLQKLLDRQSYEYILDRCCLQFEPDDPLYIKVTSDTYDHIDSHGKYDMLESTRHFGVMTFHLARYKKIDNLLVYMIHHDRLEDACSVIRLYQLIHPDCESVKEATENPQDIIMNFAKTDAVQGGKIELALQALNDIKQQ